MALLILFWVWKGNPRLHGSEFSWSNILPSVLYLSPPFIIACASEMDKMEVVVSKAMLHKYFCSVLQDVLAVQGSQTGATTELSSGSICG